MTDFSMPAEGANSATDSGANSAAANSTAANFAATVRRLAAYSTESGWQGEVFRFVLMRQHALRLTGIDRPVRGTLTTENLAIYDGDDVASYNSSATTTCIARLADPDDEAVPQPQQGPDGDGEMEPDVRPDDAPVDERAQARLFAGTTPEEAAQDHLEMLLRQRRDAVGIDDRADGLPTIEEARTLVLSLARVVGDADGDVVTLQDALRRIATNNPNRLFVPPIFPALVKLRLDDRPEWERFKSMLGNSSPPGLAEAVRRRHDEVKRRRQQRAARGRASALANDPRFVVEPGPEIDRIVESLVADKDAALAADAIDALLDVQRRVDEATTTLINMTEEDVGADEQAVDEVAAALAEIVPAVLERFRQAGARIGQVAFRLALALHAGSGAAVVERITNQTPLPRDWRLRYSYDPQHLDEGVDFCAEVMALHPDIYWSGRPVVLARDGESMPVLLPLTARALIDRIADRIDFAGDDRDRTLPDKIGRTLVERGASGHAATPRTIRGIASAPTLLDDGTLIGSAEGYEAATCVFFASPPRVMVPERPTLAQAEAALKNLRDNFATFLHADPAEPIEGDDGLLRTDTEKPAGKNETVALMLMLTIVMRPVLDIVPGFLVCGALGSGSAAGKGKLVRAISLMTTGHLPRVVAHGNTPEERAKQTVAALLKGAAVTMFDNWNGARITDDTISSAISESDYELRPLGASILLPIQRTVLVFTGNDLAPGGDNTNKFMRDDFDPHSDHPEQRPFQGDVLEAIKQQRPELLGSLLTIARSACQTRLDDPEGFNARLIGRGGAPLATRFSRWDRMVRLPLLALGCDDPATRHVDEKAKDPIRQRISDVFWTWWSAHGADKKFAGDLHQTVQKMLVPEDEISPQLLGMAVRRLRGTRQDGFQLIEVATDEEARGRRKPRALWKLVWVGPPGEEPSREQAQQDGLPLEQPGWLGGTPPPWSEEASYDSEPEV